MGILPSTSSNLKKIIIISISSRLGNIQNFKIQRVRRTQNGICSYVRVPHLRSSLPQCYQLEYLLQDRDFMHILKKHIGNPPVVQWLGLRALTARPQVHSLVRELRSWLKIKECIYVFFSFFFPYLLSVPCSMRDLSYPSSQTHAPYKGKHGGLITGPPGLSFSSPLLFFYINDSTPYKYIFHLFIFPSTPATRMDAA